MFVSLEPVTGLLTRRGAAVEQLRRAIVAGKLPPGTLLKDAEVALQLGLSATPVREALVELEAEGLVEGEPNRSKRVAPIDLQAVVELLEVQYALWGLGYAWAIASIGPAEIRRLRQLCVEHSHAIQENDWAGAIAAAFAFHGVFMHASGNRELVRVTRDRLSLIERFVLLCAPSLTAGGLAHNTKIVEALERGDTRRVPEIYEEKALDFITAVKAMRGEQINLQFRRQAS